MEHRINIDKNSRLFIEDNNYTLEYRQKPKDGGEGKNWRVGGYFPTLESLVKDWVINAPSRSETPLRSLQEVVKCIQDAEKHREKLLKIKQ